jgi:hypothetical protein
MLSLRQDALSKYESNEDKEDFVPSIFSCKEKRGDLTLHSESAMAKALAPAMGSRFSWIRRA